MDSSLQFYTIPARYPFGRILAQGLLARDDVFSEAVVLLPTRRACRGLREMFLQLTDGQPLLLPRLQPLGDVDEEELSLHLAGSEALQNFLDIPPALSLLRRRILLARLIMGRSDFRGGFDQALKLAEALGRFIDQIYIEELEFSALETLVPEEFADHWQITLEFLKILGEHWPAILQEQGMIDAADRRGRLMHALADFWLDKPPEIPVIAAGSTGSIPATTRLMEVIAGLPRGEVILPGYDMALDAGSWAALEPSHPQYGFKQLFGRVNVLRENVTLWPCVREAEPFAARDVLASEIMRPAATAQNWMRLKDDARVCEELRQACQDVSLINCDTQREEADVIALAFREVLENPGQRAALVTPDRVLAKRAAAAAQRWGIDVDDSAGHAFHQSQLGSFLILLYEAALKNLEPGAFLALLKHPYCKIADPVSIAALETCLLRGLKPRPGFEGLFARLEMRSPEIPERKLDQIFEFLKMLEPVMEPLLALCRSEDALAFEEYLKVHLGTAQNFCSDEILWGGEAGEQAAQFFTDVMAEARLMVPLRPGGYLEGLKALMEAVTIRPAYGMHPRLMILGQLEARLMDADVVILGSLNEGVWPAHAGHDPWMSRPMRKDFGLPSPERASGLSAHDFVQGFCAGKKVLLTRSKKIDGVESVPARWLMRLETVLKAADISPGILQDSRYINILCSLDMAEEVQAVSRPEPRPALEARPEKVSVTKIETWLQDPYQIYARYVLNLKPLDPINQPFDAAQMGLALHDILERFIDAHPDAMPREAEGILTGFAHDVLEESDSDEDVWSYWWPRFERIARWFCAYESEWRESARPLKVEAKGEIDLSECLQQGTFVLHGIADRIDRMKDGSAAIVDYKSGGSFSMSAMVSGKSPQLALEGLILQGGGFADLGSYRPLHLSYRILTGGTEPGKVVSIEGDAVENALENAEAGLVRLVETYQHADVPYYAQPRSDRLPRFNDYAHLARVKEWAAGSEQEDAA